MISQNPLSVGAKEILILSNIVGGGGIVKDFITKLETSKLGFVIFLQ